MVTHLSTAMAASVLTDAHTDTPCRYGVALHINHPKCHSEKREHKKIKTHFIIMDPIIHVSNICIRYFINDFDFIMAISSEHSNRIFEPKC